MISTSEISITQIDPSSWSSIANLFADHNYEQAANYAVATAKATNTSSRFYSVKRGNQLIGAACVRVKMLPIINRGIAYISSGPLVQLIGETWDEDQYKLLLGALKQHLVEREGHLLRIRLPVTPHRPELNFKTMLAELGFKPAEHGRTYETFVLDLALEESQLRSNLHRKWRSHLKQSQKWDLNFEHGMTNELRLRFLKLFNEMHKTKGFTVNVKPEFFFMLEENEPTVEIMIAHHNGQDVAGHIIASCGDTAVYLFGATNQLGRKTQAGYFLTWAAALYAKEQGLLWYDLGGVDEIKNPAGFEFKSRMGGYHAHAVGPYQVHARGIVGFVSKTLLSLYDRKKNR